MADLPLRLPESISLRSVTDADRDFLYEVYASTREEELALLSWTEAQKAAFVHMQFDAQAKYYIEHYPRAIFEIILYKGTPAGRLYIERREREIHHALRSEPGRVLLTTAERHTTDPHAANWLIPGAPRRTSLLHLELAARPHQT